MKGTIPAVLILTLILLFSGCDNEKNNASNSATKVIQTEEFNLSGFDLDGDGKNDPIWFDYSEGAHCCYTPNILMSNTGDTLSFPFEMDGGYVMGVDNSQPWHFNIKDYDQDGLPEIFMEIFTYNADRNPIPTSVAAQYGINSNLIYLDYENDKLIAKDIPDCIGAPEQYFLATSFPSLPKQLTPFLDSITQHYGYRDKNLKTRILPVLDSAFAFVKHAAFVEVGTHPYIIDEEGNILNDFQKEENRAFYQEVYITEKVYSPEGYLLVISTGVEDDYFLDTTGRIAYGRTFFDARPFKEGLAAVLPKENGYWGYLNSSFEWAILPQFETAHSFENGQAFVKKEGEYFFIGPDGLKIPGQL